MTYTTQTFPRQGGFSVLRFLAGVLVVTLVAVGAGGAVMLSPLSNAARGLTFHSSVVDRGSLVTLAPGATASVTLRFRNAGLAPWELGGPGTQVDLGVKGDSVEFAKAGMAVGWLSENRIATTTESIVPPGTVGTFTFTVRAPTTLGLYRIPVRLVVDGVTWLDDQDTYVVVASDFGFHGELIDQSPHPTLRVGETSAPIIVKLRNTGSRSWVRGTANQQVNLGVEGDDQSLKALAIGWPTADRVAIQAEPNVSPGGAATFAFRVRAPSIPGTYALRLRPVVDGVTWLEGDGVITLVTVTGASGAAPQTASASFTSSASVAPLSVSSGELATITVAFTSASAATALVGLEVYTPDGTALAFQKWFEPQTFAAGEQRTFPAVWQVPPNAALGTYSVSLRAYAPGWKSLFSSKDAAAKLIVAAPGAVPATSSNPATAAPTAGSGQGQSGGPSPAPSAAPSTAPSAAPSAAPPSFTSSASVTPASVNVGGSVTVSASFTSDAPAIALVSVSIYSPTSAIAVHQQSFDNQSFVTGQSRSYPVAWSVPANVATGTYRVSLGVFSPGWTTPYSWKDAAATFAVMSPTPTPAPTAAPSATPNATATPAPTAVPTAAPLPGYGGVVLADSPIAYWRLGEASGTAAADSGAGARHGTYVGSPALGSTGALVDATTGVRLDGVDDRVEVPHHSSLAFERTQRFSIELWAKWSSASTKALVAKMKRVEPFRGYDVVALNTGSILFQLISDNAANNGINVTTTAAFNNDAWHHIVVTYDGSSRAAGVVIHVDGTSRTLTTQTDTLTGSTVDTTTALTIGGREGNSIPFAGLVDEVAFYNTSLAAARVKAHYDAARPPGVTPAPTAVPTPTTVPPPQTGLSPLRVQGNKLVNALGQVAVLHGAARSGTEYQCLNGARVFEGPSDAASLALMKSWGMNAVRIPMNEDCWLAINGMPAATSGAAYQQAIKNYVNLLNQNGMYAILDLHWSAPGTTQARSQQPMPDRDHSPTFWSQVANAYKGNNTVIFELYNEPWPDGGVANSTAAWICWRDGGTCPGVPFQAAGMQELVNAVRATGATNVLALGGLRWSNYLTQWLAYKPHDPLNNLVAAWHIYEFNTCNNVACYESTVAPVLAQVPVLATEFGSHVCDATFMNTLMNWLDARQLGYFAWTWNTWSTNCYPQSLISDYVTGTPTTYGLIYKTHLAGLR